MDRTFLLAGAVAGFLGVGFGAFGAHALRARISPEMLAVFETGVRYQMYHALALLLTSLVMSSVTRSWLVTTAGWSFIAGIVLFSGSLYGLAVARVAMLGAVTPLGGLAFLVGWGCLALAAAGL